MQHSHTEENYLKTIWSLANESSQPVTTTAIALRLNTAPASVTDMLKKLAQKGLVSYKKYYGVSVSKKGEKAALNIIRKHRLWEVFLKTKLNFKWDEVHDMAELLEHSSSDELIRRLDIFLGYPRTDPHGDPIPDEKGRMTGEQFRLLSACKCGEQMVICSPVNNEKEFLQHLTAIGLLPGVTVHITEMLSYDNSMQLQLGKRKKIWVSADIAAKIKVRKMYE